ncbi:MAG: CpsB/CapC family capsule biosynthesis tyrosine phosphatase [Enterocloster sp.]
MARYIPVIAHVERYTCLREGTNLSELVQCDCRLQMNFSRPEWETAYWIKRFDGAEEQITGKAGFTDTGN